MKEKRSPKRQKSLAMRTLIAVRIPENLAHQISIYCRQTRTSTSNFIRQAAHNELERLKSA